MFVNKFCTYLFMLQIAEYGEGLVVYSLGITLIEMFIGRSPTDDMFRDGLSLHYFAEAKVMKIADSRIWLHDEANKRNATRDITRTKECFVSSSSLVCCAQGNRPESGH